MLRLSLMDGQNEGSERGLVQPARDGAFKDPAAGGQAAFSRDHQNQTPSCLVSAAKTGQQGGMGLALGHAVQIDATIQRQASATHPLIRATVYAAAVAQPGRCQIQTDLTP